MRVWLDKRIREPLAESSRSRRACYTRDDTLATMAHQGAYRTAAARASQYRLELDHLKHSRDNAMRREHELERALDEERHRASTREAELKRNLRNAKCDAAAAPACSIAARLFRSRAQRVTAPYDRTVLLRRWSVILSA